MNSLRDIELTIKKALSEREDSDTISISVDTAELLLARLKEYRQRINKNASKFHVRIGKLQSELHNYECLHKMARNRMDPEARGTGYSQVDEAKVALYIEAIESVRGRIVAQRMLWGYSPDPDIQNETISTLREAIEEARRDRDRWYKHLEEARAKLTPLQALTIATWREECKCSEESHEPA